MAKGGGRRTRLLDDLQVPEVYREPADLPRPYLYDERIASELCAHIAKGKSIRSFCVGRGRPSDRNVYRWLRDQPTFVHEFVRAREEAAMALVEDIIEISDRTDLEP